MCVCVHREAGRCAILCMYANEKGLYCVVNVLQYSVIERELRNRRFPSCLSPLFQSES